MTTPSVQSVRLEEEYVEYLIDIYYIRFHYTGYLLLPRL